MSNRRSSLIKFLLDFVISTPVLFFVPVNYHHPRRHLSRSTNIIQSQENFRENNKNDFGNANRIGYHSIQIRRRSSMTCNPPTNNLLNSKSAPVCLLSFVYLQQFFVYIFSEIKHRLLTMDLLNQMDKAKELTHFAMTHQAISKEDKE